VPSAKIKTFASVTVDRMAIADNSTVEFRDVPAVVPPGKRK
jgi:hypothetical protein